MTKFEPLIEFARAIVLIASVTPETAFYFKDDPGNSESDADPHVEYAVEFVTDVEAMGVPI